MQTDEKKFFITLNELLEKSDKVSLRTLLNDHYPQDIAEYLKNLDEKNRLNCFLLLDLEHASDVLAELNPEIQKELIELLGKKYFAPIISNMDIDDATHLISNLEEEEKNEIIEILPDPVQQAHLQESIQYKPESAGRIMTNDFLRLRDDMTIQSALNYVRKLGSEKKELVYYLYVVDQQNHLVGIISLKDIICAPLNDTVGNHMNNEVITCNVNEDQETVSQIMSKYDLIAIPVVDEINLLKGIITVDDVVDVLKKETTEDIYQSSGITNTKYSDELISGKVNYAFKARLPWLLITLIGEAIAAFIISSHNSTISSSPIAISFMPLLSGLSGNVGGQTATIIVRGLVTGDIELKNTLKHIYHELKIGFLLGITCSIITGLIAWKQHNMPYLGLLVAVALTFSMISGVLLGTIFPILLKYLKKDPAAASSPIITTLLDILTFTFYLTVISLTLKYF